jgi:hypothetical protein
VNNHLQMHVPGDQPARTWCHSRAERWTTGRLLAVMACSQLPELACMANL